MTASQSFMRRYVFSTDHKVIGIQYLLTALVEPSRDIAKGYESITVELDDGRVLTGLVQRDDAEQLHLFTPEGELEVLPQDQIEYRSRSLQSAMPADLVEHLTLEEIRDLVAYLAAQQAPRQPAAGTRRQ